MSVDERQSELFSKVRDNLLRVQERIHNAASKANRSPDEITLVGVTKYVGVEETLDLIEAGCNTLGESRPQQLWEKSAEESLREANWHLIGHLQRNKVDRTLPSVDLIHGVDSRRLLEAINRSAKKQQLQPTVLLEVNCSGDEAKHGFEPEELKEILEDSTGYDNVRIEGLMTMAAREGGTTVARKNFALLRQLVDNLHSNTSDQICFKTLSMGMSGDFEEAILEGSTMIRVGSALWEGIKE